MSSALAIEEARTRSLGPGARALAPMITITILRLCRRGCREHPRAVFVARSVPYAVLFVCRAIRSLEKGPLLLVPSMSRRLPGLGTCSLAIAGLVLREGVDEKLRDQMRIIVSLSILPSLGDSKWDVVPWRKAGVACVRTCITPTATKTPVIIPALR